MSKAVVLTLNQFEDFVVVHIQQTLTIHYTGNFPPWHRWFLYQYEKALRDECGYKGYQPVSPPMIALPLPPELTPLISTGTGQSTPQLLRTPPSSTAVTPVSAATATMSRTTARSSPRPRRLVATTSPFLLEWVAAT